MQELHLKYRPKKFSDLVGQDQAVKLLKSMEKKQRFPHFLLLQGPSGCGKTSIARIVARKLNCFNTDLIEINAADFRGVETVRSIREKMNLMAMHGETRCWIIDECQQLTSTAQNAFLKVLEEPPDWVYFCFATTNAGKLLETIRTRCRKVRVKHVSETDILKLLVRVCKKEKATHIGKSALTKIAKYCEGSPRQALVMLESILDIQDKDEQANAIEDSRVEKKAIDLARALMRKNPSWKTVAPLTENLEDDIETVRNVVLSYASKILRSGGKNMHYAYLVIDAFAEPFFYSREAGLLGACYECVFRDSDKA